MRRASRISVLYLAVILAAAGGTRALEAGATKQPAAAEAADLVRAVRQSEMWMHEFDSLYVRARGSWTSTPEAIAARRRQIKTEYGIDDPNEKQFPGIRKASHDTLEYAMDRRRVRHLTDDPGYWRQLEVWDGNELRIHEKYYYRGREFYILNSRIPPRTFHELPSCDFGWPRSQPHSFWWDAKSTEAAMSFYGPPERFQLVGTQNYRDIPCHVLQYEMPRETVTGLTFRWFVGQADHLLHGIQTLQEGKITVEHWALNYREVVPGGWFPMHTGWSFYDTDDSGRTRLRSTRNLEVIELRVNEPLPDSLFTLTIEPDVEVQDERSGTLRVYRQDRPVLSGRKLPPLPDTDPPAPRPREDRPILVVFVDLEQRPCRRALQDLGACSAVVKNRVEALLIQVAPLSSEALTQWREKLKIPLPVRTLRSDAEAVCRSWGARSLPWLVLTDTGHTVRAEGFAPGELDSRMEPDR
jgi:hypothetical protein